MDIKLRPVRVCVRRAFLAGVCVVVVVVIVRFFVVGTSDATVVAGVTGVDSSGGCVGCSHTTGSRKDCSKTTDEAKTGADDEARVVDAAATATAAAGSSVGSGSSAVEMPERCSLEEVENEEWDWEYCDGYDAALEHRCRWGGRGGWCCGEYCGGEYCCG